MGGYNCFEFALGLAGDPKVGAIAKCFTSTVCNTDFVDYLKASSILATTLVPSPGNLVLYRNADCFTHAGVVHAEALLSKWGRGHPWVHDRWEVPASYGDSLEFSTLTDADVSQKFVDFAREREGPFVDEVLEAL